MADPKDYKDYTPEDWDAQVKADEFDALWRSNQHHEAREEAEGNG